MYVKQQSVRILCNRSVSICSLKKGLQKIFFIHFPFLPQTHFKFHLYTYQIRSEEGDQGRTNITEKITFSGLFFFSFFFSFVYPSLRITQFHTHKKSSYMAHGFDSDSCQTNSNFSSLIKNESKKILFSFLLFFLAIILSTTSLSLIISPSSSSSKLFPLSYLIVRHWQQGLFPLLPLHTTVGIS